MKKSWLIFSLSIGFLLGGCLKKGVLTYNQGVYLYQHKQYQPALEKFIRSTKENPQFGEAYLALGSVRKILAQKALRQKPPANSSPKKRALFPKQQQKKALAQYLATLEAWKKATSIFQLEKWKIIPLLRKKLAELEKEENREKQKLDKLKVEGLIEKQKQVIQYIKKTEGELQKKIDDLVKKRSERFVAFGGLSQRYVSKQVAVLSDLESFWNTWAKLPKVKGAIPINRTILLTLIENGAFFKAMVPFAKALAVLKITHGSGLEFFLNPPSKLPAQYERAMDLLQQALDKNPHFQEAQLLLMALEGVEVRALFQLSQNKQKLELRRGPALLVPASLLAVGSKGYWQHLDKRMEKLLGDSQKKGLKFSLFLPAKIRKKAHEALKERRESAQLLATLKISNPQGYGNFLRALVAVGGHIRGLNSYLLACRLYQQEKYDRSLKLFDRALQVNPTFGEALYLRSCCRIQQSLVSLALGKKKQAKISLQRAKKALLAFLVPTGRHKNRQWIIYSLSARQKALLQGEKFHKWVRELLQKGDSALVKSAKLGDIFDATW